jgi:hypothetical protein
MATLTNGQTGSFDTLTLNTVDGNAKPLTWVLRSNSTSIDKREYWEAFGSDGMFYRVIDNTAKPAKTGIVTISSV